MENKEYKYDAFISYRHCELDKFVAENLHKILEKYELPKNVKKKLNIKNRTIKRVFRDQEELPLSSNLEDPIVDALENSKYLIVICSPRLKDSLWCKKEIETFKKLRGRKNIFCVLIEGEPVDSFPEDLLTDDDNKTPVEPLAADVRGKNKKEVLKKIKSEKLRLVAPMYNLDYDDLRQRHKLRRQKRILNISIIVAIFCLLFALYTSMMLIKINNQQKKLKKNQAIALAEKSTSYFANDSRYNAIKTAYQSLTKFEGVNMPYTTNAEYALAESLGIYDVGLSYKTSLDLKTEGAIVSLKSSTNYKYNAIYDGSEKITLYDSKELKVIKEFNLDNTYFDEKLYDFVGNDYLAYVNNKGSIILVNTKDGKKVDEIKKPNSSYISLLGSYNGKYLVYMETKKLYIYDIAKKEVIYKQDTDEQFVKNIYITKDDNYLFVQTIYKEQKYDLSAKEEMTIHVIDLNKKEEINNQTYEAGYIEGMIVNDNNVYILMNRMIGTDFTMIVSSYDYINNIVNWTNEYDDNWGKYINRSYKNNYIAVVNSNIINVLDGETGQLVETFSSSSNVINIYSYLDSDMFLIIEENGTVSTINMNSKINVVVPGRYQFKAGEYEYVTLTEDGFILVPKNDNRVILYEAKVNDKAKKLDIELDYLSDDSIPLSDYDDIKNNYNVKNKSLVTKIFYDSKKKVLFINYQNNDVVIYDVETKKILNKLKNVNQVNHYFGKDKYNRTYIGNINESYILDENYNLVGHIVGLRQLKKDKVVIGSGNNYYELKIYTLDDLKNEAKKYLNKYDYLKEEIDYDEYEW